MKEMIESVVNMEEIVGPILVAIAMWIGSRPFVQRKLISMAFRYGIRYVLKLVNKYHYSFPEGSQERADMREIVEAITILARLLGEKIGIPIKPKILEPGRSRASRRDEKKESRNKWKYEQRKVHTMQKKKTKELREALRNSVKIVLILIAMTFCFNVCATGYGEVDANGWGRIVFFEHEPFLAIGIAWDMDDWEKHSYAYTTPATWKNSFLDIDFNVGLIDFEQVETTGDLWYESLNPAVGLSVDVLQALERFPVLEQVIDYIPGFVSVGTGIYLRAEDPWTSTWYVSASIKL